LIEWVKTVDRTRKTVSPDLKLIKIVDTEEEVVEVLVAFYKKYNLKPNFNSKSCFTTALFLY
jgi:hypothetical protein